VIRIPVLVTVLGCACVFTELRDLPDTDTNGPGETHETGNSDTDGSTMTGDTGNDVLPCQAPDHDVQITSYERDIFPIHSGICGRAGCHGVPSGNGLEFPDPDRGYMNIINVPGKDGIEFIVPGEPENSYMWHKLAGTHLLIGGTGSQMPGSGESLCPQDFALFYRWILEGAAP